VHRSAAGGQVDGDPDGRRQGDGPPGQPLRARPRQEHPGVEADRHAAEAHQSGIQASGSPRSRRATSSSMDPTPSLDALSSTRPPGRERRSHPPQVRGGLGSVRSARLRCPPGSGGLGLTIPTVHIADDLREALREAVSLKAMCDRNDNAERCVVPVSSPSWMGKHHETTGCVATETRS
jgi:hypothetical protein